MTPSGSGSAVGLFGLHSQTTCGVPGRDSDRVRIEGPAVPGRQTRDGEHARAALLGQDAVHGVGRDRDHGRAAGRQERLRDEVEDLVGPGSDQDLVLVDAVAGGCRFDQPPVIRRRVFGQARLEATGRQQPLDERRRGRGGVQVEPHDPLTRDAVPSGDLIVGRFPRIRGGCGGRGERHGRDPHRLGAPDASSANRISTASRWASSPSASASVATVSRMAASPARSTRWTWTNLP